MVKEFAHRPWHPAMARLSDGGRLWGVLDSDSPIHYYAVHVSSHGNRRGGTPACGSGRVRAGFGSV